jgi:drug/metabolite transporter (DMT)-like permease
MESVFAAVLGFLFLRELLTVQQLIGSVLVMAAIVLAQVRVKQVAPV